MMRLGNLAVEYGSECGKHIRLNHRVKKGEQHADDYGEHKAERDIVVDKLAKQALSEAGPTSMDLKMEV